MEINAQNVISSSRIMVVRKLFIDFIFIFTLSQRKHSFTERILWQFLPYVVW